MWDKAKLAALAERRKGALSDVEGALLAFARAREMTDEAGIDVREAERTLDELLDGLEPDVSDQLKALGSFARDEVVRDFLARVVDHTQARLAREQAEVVALSRDAEAQDAPSRDDDGAKRKRRGLKR